MPCFQIAGGRGGGRRCSGNLRAHCGRLAAASVLVSFAASATASTFATSRWTSQCLGALVFLIRGLYTRSVNSLLHRILHSRSHKSVTVWSTARAAQVFCTLAPPEVLSSNEAGVHPGSVLSSSLIHKQCHARVRNETCHDIPPHRHVLSDSSCGKRF